MEGEVSDFQDWEVLQSSESVIGNSRSGLLNSARCFDGIEGDSEGMIRSDYFSIDSVERYDNNLPHSDPDEGSSVHSNSPSWIDPGSENRYPRKNSGEFWSDSSSNRSDGRKHGDFEENIGPCGGESVKGELGFVEIGEMGAGDANSSNFGYDDSKITTFVDKNEFSFVDNRDSQLGFEGYGETESLMRNSGKFWSDSGGGCRKDDKIGVDDYKNTEDGIGILGARSDGETVQPNVTENDDMGDVKAVTKVDSEEAKRKVVWWKVPLELLKYCALRISPVWSVSLAAAVMGLVILGHRIYKMKKKTRSLELKVIVDDKKVSQFMSRAARLNEAFSVVRRVPLIRPSFPPAGLAPWPVMSMR